MKKFLSKVWRAINSPMADIIGGYVMMIVGIISCYYCSELTVPCVVAFVSGCIITIGFDCVDHGFARRKSSGKPDDNK